MTTEPWLREIDLGIHPALAQPIFALQQVREDLEQHTAGVTDAQVWLPVNGLTPLGFHLRHIAGSTERLTTYLLGEQLSDVQLAAMREEKTPGHSLGRLLSDAATAMDNAASAIRTIDPERLGEPRFIGRKRIRTTVVGLAIHIGEHAQRHTGQAITTCHVIRLSGI